MAFWCVDPINGSDATGSERSTQALAETTPFKTWSAVTWRVGDTYSQRRGTTAYEEVIIDRTGEPGQRITLDAYGESGDAPVIDAEHTRGNCIKMIGKSHITVRNFQLHNATQAGCLQAVGSKSRGPDELILEDLVCSGNLLGDGINVTHNNPGPTARNITIRRCIAEDNGNSGLTTDGNLDGVLIDRCTARRNGFAQNSWGIHAAPYQAKFARGQWRRISNWIYEVDLQPGDVAMTVNVSQSNFDYRRMRPGDWNRLTPNEFAQSGTTVRFNPNENIDLHGTPFPVRIQLSTLKNVLVVDSVAEDQYSFDGGDGTGMGFDIFTESSEFRRCSAIRSAKQGFSLNDNNGEIYLVGCESISPGLNTDSPYGAFCATRGIGTRYFINCTAVDSHNAAFLLRDRIAALYTGSYEFHNILAEFCASGLESTAGNTPINHSGVVLYRVTTPGFANFYMAAESSLATTTSPLLLRQSAEAIGRGTLRSVPDPRDRRGVYRVTLDAGANYYIPRAPGQRQVAV
jgi:hypothetical protein